MSIVLFFAVLAVLILVHEFGHFLFAKWFGVRVDEFGLGFPPRLFGVRRGETLYSVNAVPFGGFVKIYGEKEEEVTEADKERSLAARPRYKQAAIIAAGVLFNFIFAWLLITGGFLSGLPMPVSGEGAGSAVQNPLLTITAIDKNSPAAETGLRVGDRITMVSRETEKILNPSLEQVQEFIATHGGRNIDIAVTRGSVEEIVSVIPRDGIVPGKPAIGIAMDMIGVVRLPIHEALWEALKVSATLTVAVIDAFGNLISDALKGHPDVANLTGPIGIVGLVGDAAQFGFVYLLGFTAFISINLAVFNLLPFPALDGGRLLFLIVEALTGKSINSRIVNMLHLSGFVLLVTLLLVVSYYDLVRYGVF